MSIPSDPLENTFFTPLGPLLFGQSLSLNLSDSSDWIFSHIPTAKTIRSMFINYLSYCLILPNNTQGTILNLSIISVSIMIFSIWTSFLLSPISSFQTADADSIMIAQHEKDKNSTLTAQAGLKGLVRITMKCFSSYTLVKPLSILLPDLRTLLICQLVRGTTEFILIALTP